MPTGENTQLILGYGKNGPIIVVRCVLLKLLFFMMVSEMGFFPAYASSMEIILGGAPVSSQPLINPSRKQIFL